MAAAALALLGTRPSRLTLSSGGASVELAGGKAGAAPVPAAGAEQRTSLRALWAAEPAGFGRIEDAAAFFAGFLGGKKS